MRCSRRAPRRASATPREGWRSSIASDEGTSIAREDIGRADQVTPPGNQRTSPGNQRTAPGDQRTARGDQGAPPDDASSRLDEQRAATKKATVLTGPTTPGVREETPAHQGYRSREHHR